MLTSTHFYGRHLPVGGMRRAEAGRPRVRKVTVLLPQNLFVRFDAYCRAGGFKKSTLITKLIRDLLAQEQDAKGSGTR